MLKNLIIRKAKLKDITQTAKLAYKLNDHHAKFDRYYTLNKDALSHFKTFHKRNIYSKKSLFLVAEYENKIIGYVIGKMEERPPIFKEKDIGFVMAMYVKEKFRRQGIAKMFLDKLLSWFKKNKITNIELHVHPKNDPGIKAWEKSGFKTFLFHQRVKL